MEDKESPSADRPPLWLAVFLVGLARVVAAADETGLDRLLRILGLLLLGLAGLYLPLVIAYAIRDLAWLGLVPQALALAVAGGLIWALARLASWRRSQRLADAVTPS